MDSQYRYLLRLSCMQKYFLIEKDDPTMLFYIAFGDKSNDSFSIGADINLSGEYERAIKALQERAQDEVFLDIRKLGIHSE